MSDVDKAIATQLANLEKRSGKSLAELTAIVRASGLTKHGEIRDMLKRDLGLGHGDANTLTHYALQSAGPGGAAGQSADDTLAGLYTGAKSALRPIHDRLMSEINTFGAFEIAPKKTYVSLRRKKQFAMIGPATNTQVEVGLNMKDAVPTARLLEMPPKSMCNYKVRLSDVREVDAALIGWLRQAFDSAG
ncbi:MAG: DUF5655 domain-containing protein [Blastocatellia bacterium]